MTLIADVTAVLAAAGLVQAGAGLVALKRFSRQSRPGTEQRPPVTILKPLKGEEPLLEAALISFCTQSYPEYQLVFGVQNRADPAIAVVQRLQRLFPERDITLVVDETQHGGNRKIANLINMWPEAKHEVVVLADSDVHVRPQFLERMVAALDQPGVGVATTLYAGVPTGQAAASAFGAAQINHFFLGGVLLGRLLGRQDCLGAAVALRRSTLMRIGGLPALLPHLADDAMLGRLVRGLGLRVALAPGVVVTTVSEETLGALFHHELRWARTIRALEPFTYATTVLQFPVLWALLTWPASGFRLWPLGLIAVVWGLRAWTMRAFAGQLGRGAFSGWLLPVREIFSLIVLCTSYFGNRVVWRGSSMAATMDRPRLKAGSGKVSFSKLRFGKSSRLTRGINQL